MGHAVSSGLELWHTIALTLAFVAFMLVVGRWLIDRTLPWVQAHTSFPGGVLGFALVLTIGCAAFTEWIGVHAIFGAFICGVALGDSRHLRPRTREIIEQFVSFIFAPLFFASIGLRVDFAANFDLALVLIVLVLATVGKLAGCVVSARFAGFRRREAWAIGFGMNARGAMEIILSLLALEAGLINERLFVALVVMALLTSITSGMLVQWSLGKHKTVKFWTYASSKSFLPNLDASDSTEAIRSLARAASEVNPALSADVVAEAALARERLMGSGIGGGIAVPHARLAEIDTPVVAIGRAPRGVDFAAPDEKPARLIILLVTPASQPEYQLRLLASIARTAQSADTVDRLAEASSWTEFLAALNTDATPALEHG
ncbi:MAG: cation:proton antiporter, partial [Phycisphaeraceae bacterium]|nr:cation:proton antiporter [Phycisphaeraceae bacterium]